MLPPVSSLPLFKDKKQDKRKLEKKNSEQDSISIKRQRTFESVRNQFVVHVKLELEPNVIKRIGNLSTELQNVFHQNKTETSSESDSKKSIKCFPNVEFETEWHLSLLRGHYAVQYHQLIPLMNDLVRRAETFEEFTFQLCDFTIFSNEEQSRHFLVIADEESFRDDEKYKLVYGIADTLARHRAELRGPTHQALRSFLYHVSLASSGSKELAVGLEQKFKQSELFKGFTVQAKSVFIRIGHFQRSVKLLPCSSPSTK